MPPLGRQFDTARLRRLLIATCAFVSLLWLSPSAQDPGAPSLPALLGVPAALPQDGVPDILIGPMRDGGGIVRLFSGAAGHALLAQGAPFGAFTGGVRVATGDLDGDNIADFVVAQGPGGGLVRAFSGADVHEIAIGYPFGPEYAGGVNVALADVTGDGRDDVIVAMATGPWVKVYNLVGGLSEVVAGTPYGQPFPQGVRVAAGDVNADGRADVITAPDTGGGLVRVFNGAGPATIVSVPFPQNVYVATGDLDGDNHLDVVLSPSASAGPIVAFNATTYAPLGSFGTGVPGGISIAVADITGDGHAEVIGGLGPGSSPFAGVIDHTLHQVLSAFEVATSAPLPNGVYVAAAVPRGIRFTSADTTTFTTGSAGTFTVTTSAGPTVTTITSSGTLPGGVTFTDNHDGTATLSGTPAAGSGDDYALTFTASNGVAAPETQTFTLRVEGAPQITSGDTTTFNVNAPGTFTVTTSGFPTPALSHSGTLPTGVTFTDRGDGTATVAGTPGNGSGGTYTLSITASNGVGANATQTFTLLVDASPAFTSAAATTFTVGAPGTFAISATAEPAIATITQSGALPAGVAFIDNGGGSATLSGTPTASGVFTLTLTAANGGVGADAVQSFTLTVQAAPVITSATTVTFTVGAPATFDVISTGFPTPALTFSGALPAGLTFVDDGDGTATLAGTPAAGAGGVYPLTVTSTNSAGTNNGGLTITVEEGPTFTSAAAATFKVGELGTLLVTATGLPTPGLTLTAGAPPAGVTFSDNGNGTASLSGTPAPGTGGTYPLTFTANNLIGPPVTQSFVLTVNQDAVFSSAVTTTFTVGQAGTFTVDVDAFPVAAITTADTLPSGVTLTDNSDGTATLAGTPASGTTGSHPITFSADNGLGAPVTQSFTLAVHDAPAITSADTTTFIVGSPSGFTVQTSGTPAPSITRGGVAVLPSSLSWIDNGDGTGTLNGVPAAGTGGTYALTFQATNSVGTSTLQTFTLNIHEAPAITSATSTTFTVGASTPFTVIASGFPFPAITAAAALPGGVTLTDHGDGTATLGGTPTAGTGGTHTVTLQATNSQGAATPQTFTLTINQAPAITSAATATFTVGASSSFDVLTSGFPAPSIARGGATLPNGVIWIDDGDGTGRLTGTPIAGTGGTYALTFQASNVAGTSATQNFTLTVNEQPAFTSAASASYVAGTVVSFPLTASGMPAPDITQTSGTLPTGLSYNNTTNTIEGTPTQVGNFTPQFTATNGVLPNAVQNFALEITCAPITVSSTPGTMPGGIFNVLYGGATFSQVGGGAGTWSATNLPPGLTLDANSGVLSGTPSNTGVFAGTVTYTVPGPCTGTKNISITIAPNAQNDTYAPGFGNTQVVAAAHSAPATPFFAFPTSVFANDSGPAGTVVVAVPSATTTLGGAITIAANGAFTYTPQAGDTGNDTFTYSITSNGVAATAVITLQLGTQRIWYVDDVGSNGSGTSSSPFNTLTSVSGAGDADGDGDIIYVHPGTYAGSLTTEANQTVWGAGTAYTPNANMTIAAGAKPTLQGTLTIAGNNVTISSLALSTSTSTGITNSGIVAGLTVKNDVTVATTTGTAVSFSNVNSTAGGAPNNGINFRSVSASGAASGIVLNAVNQTAGSFTVIGDGGGANNGSGGTIQNTTGTSVLVTGARNLSLGYLTITSAGDSAADDGMHLTDLSGTFELKRTSISGSEHNNVRVVQNSGTLASLTLTNVTIAGAIGNSGMDVAVSGAAIVTAINITNSTFQNNFADGLQIDAAGTSNVTATIQGNAFTGNNLGLDLDQNGGGTASYKVLSNNFQNHPSHAINVFSDTLSSSAAVLQARIESNTIGTNGVIDSGSKIGNAIRINMNGDARAVALVNNNQIHEVPNARTVEIVRRLSATAAPQAAHVTVTNNSVTVPTGTTASIGCGAGVPCPGAVFYLSSDSGGPAPPPAGFPTINLHVAGNTAYNPIAAFALGSEGAYRLREVAGATTQLFGAGANPTAQIAGSNTTTAPVGATPVNVDAGVSLFGGPVDTPVP